MARRRAGEQQTLRLDDRDPWQVPAIKKAIEQRADREGDSALAERLDDYVNRLTGIGDYLQDKTFGGSKYGLDYMVRFMSAIDVEDRWRGSDLGARIVETVPAEMVREGWEVIVQPTEEDDQDDEPKVDAFPPGGGANPAAAVMLAASEPKAPLPEIDDEGAELSEAFEGKLEEIGASAAILTALQYRRAYGGGAILIGADDGVKDLTKPLDEENIKSIGWLNPLQGGPQGEIIAWSYYRDPSEPKYGEPEIYMVRNIGVPLTQTDVPGVQSPNGTAPGRKPVVPLFWIHESRLLVFSATAVSRRARVQMRGWGDSVFTRIDEVLSQYSQTWGGVANLMTDFKQDVLAIDGAAQKSAADRTSKGNPLLKRARTIQQTKSIARMLVIDKLTEEFKREMASVQGISEVLEQFAIRLAAAADMPVTLLFGQAPSGLNATGASDIRFFYDRIAAEQRRILVPALKRLVKLIALSQDGPTQGQEPERWNVNPHPLYQLSALEEAQRRLAIAQTDQIYITQGVLSAEEVAAGAFGGSEFSAERTIDFDGREQVSEQEAKDKEMRMKTAAAMLANPPAPQQPELDQPATPEPKTSKADDLSTVAQALDMMRKAGAVVDLNKLKEQFPDLPVKRIIEEE